jgi:signal transduction histidine kinase
MPEVRGISNSRIATSADGRIWLATTDGLAVIDPRKVGAKHVPPPVVIEQLRLPPGSTPSAVHGRSVEIDYTALSLTLPETVRFRYRLEPIETDWVDAGTRREIAYANLAPGNYRFRVTARDEDGTWNADGAAVTFTVAPEFYQTWAFWSTCVCLFALGAYTLHKARIRHLRERFAIVLRERTRLSRELHDTLLQGFAGVVYQLEAATRQLDTQPEAGRRRLAQALEQADQSLREARQALSCMRLTDLENTTLAEAVRRAGERIVDGSSIDFQLEVTGRTRELPYDIQANLFVIAREAMNNAVAHGRPEHITVNVDYRGEAVALAVKDNGRGFQLDSGRRKPDHWGLAGMQERARHMGADFAIHTAPGMGTTVEVVVNKLPRKQSSTI